MYGPGDDEEEFGSNHAERRGQHACALGRSIAVHFSYNTWLCFQHFWTKSDSTFFQRSASGRDLDIYHFLFFEIWGRKSAWWNSPTYWSATLTWQSMELWLNTSWTEHTQSRESSCGRDLQIGRKQKLEAKPQKPISYFLCAVPPKNWYHRSPKTAASMTARIDCQLESFHKGFVAVSCLWL